MWKLEKGTENELEQINRTCQVGSFLNVLWRQPPWPRATPPPSAGGCGGVESSGLFFLNLGELNEHWNVSVIWTARI